MLVDDAAAVEDVDESASDVGMRVSIEVVLLPPGTDKAVGAGTEAVGPFVGATTGLVDGVFVGVVVKDGSEVGCGIGSFDGAGIGSDDGPGTGTCDGAGTGALDGAGSGSMEGDAIGRIVGAGTGIRVGVLLGTMEGSGVG